jgi:hypothetical protein
MTLLLRRVGAGQQHIKRHANTPPQKRVHSKYAACIIKVQCSCLVTTCNGQQQKASSAPLKLQGYNLQHGLLSLHNRCSSAASKLVSFGRH